MQTKTIQASARISPDIYATASAVAENFGLDLSSAIRMFVTRIAKTHTIPLEITKPVVSLDGDSFASDMDYFRQIPGFIEKLVATDHEPREDMMQYNPKNPKAFWNSL
jgi:addiction module RelB/DinJ family antitoxin